MTKQEAVEISDVLRREVEAFARRQTPSGRARHEEAKFIAYAMADVVCKHCPEIDMALFLHLVGVP